MDRDWLTVVRYLMAAEDSRLGRKDIWNAGFLPGLPPLWRVGLGLCKMTLVIAMAFGTCMALSLM